MRRKGEKEDMIYVYIHIHIYREREAERGQDKGIN